MTRFYTAKLLHKDIPTVNYEYLNTRELFNHKHTVAKVYYLNYIVRAFVVCDNENSGLLLSSSGSCLIGDFGIIKDTVLTLKAYSLIHYKSAMDLLIHN